MQTKTTMCIYSCWLWNGSVETCIYLISHEKDIPIGGRCSIITGGKFCPLRMEKHIILKYCCNWNALFHNMSIQQQMCKCAANLSISQRMLATSNNVVNWRLKTKGLPHML